jgi:hypothetical protein
VTERTDRNRMIFALPPEVQLAIRIRATKDGVTTGEVVRRAVLLTWKADVIEARAILLERKGADS